MHARVQTVRVCSCGRLIMSEDYEADYEDFVDNPPRLIACPPDNVTDAPPSVVGGPSGDGYCVQPFTLDDSRQTVVIYGVVSPLFVVMTLVTNCLVSSKIVSSQIFSSLTVWSLTVSTLTVSSEIVSSPTVSSVWFFSSQL